MDNEKVKEADTLVIAAKFPPVTSTSGLVFAKRIIQDGESVDLIQGRFERVLDWDFNDAVDEFVDNRMIVDIDPFSDNINTIDKFLNEGISQIENLNKEYETIRTRSFPITNNFLAFDYKLKHPDTTWIAEFSDPLLLDMENRERGRDKEHYHYHNEELIGLANLQIDEINEGNDFKLDLIKDGDNVFFISEYLAFIFADKLIFTNSNQREVMLSVYPDFLKDMVIEKSEIKAHPTLSEEYYHIKETSYDLDENCINLGYFGTYLPQRNFETIFYALDSLNTSHKVKFHMFLSKQDCEYLAKLINDLDIAGDVILNERVSQLEFLNICTKLDVLIVNDSSTGKYFKLNPFLPSKLSDYLGSGNDVWAICEENSILASIDGVKYRSYIDDYKSARDALSRIMEDKLSISNDSVDDKLSITNDSVDDNLGMNNDSLSVEEELKMENEYLKARVNYLNRILPKKDLDRTVKQKNKKIKKLKSKNKSLKRKNDEILNSKSWKLTAVFRKFGRLF